MKPQLETTTLWDFPSQSYGVTPKGNNRFHGVTPAFVIYNLVQRYTQVGDLVMDPMCGSGTTIDVCKEEKRRVIGFDLTPTRPDIIPCDARQISLPNSYCDMVFIDPPYGDNIKYSSNPLDIGHISHTAPEFQAELFKVAIEIYRVLKPWKTIAWLTSDYWKNKLYVPVAFQTFNNLCRLFMPVDTICISRRNQTSHTMEWHLRALQSNFYLRGFKYLFIMRKEK